MPDLATWIRPRDEKYFAPFFANHKDIKIYNAAQREVPFQRMDGLLLTGGADISPEFLRQELPDPTLIENDADPKRDKWEFEAVDNALTNSIAILAICKGLQVLNVALGGTLHLDIRGHNLIEQKTSDVQLLRHDQRASHHFEKVNSSHHQAIDRLGEGLEVEAWSATDDIIEQVRLRRHPFALAVQYHPERGLIYEELFEDFFARLLQ